MIWLLKRGAAVVALMFAFGASPVAYVELACRPSVVPSSYTPILPPEHHRPEGRTLLTYPEWHIVHAYDDYAQVIADGAPHDYAYFKSVAGFWRSLCSVSKASGPVGGFPNQFKSTIYTIGISFTFEMLAKALYEETLGRFAVVMRGDEPASLDILSAQQAAQYAQFLQQVPWYQWDFERDAVALKNAETDVWRDCERRFALGVEYGLKARYARVIKAAVANLEPDALRLRLIVRDLQPNRLSAEEGVEVKSMRPEGIEVEAPRYRALTKLLDQWAAEGADFVGIAGNDDIMLTVTSSNQRLDQAIYSFDRQGYDDTRHLVLVPVSDLAATLRGFQAGVVRLEHIHDY